MSRRTGTVVASALAAGVAALVKAARPQLNAARLKEALIAGADDNPDLYGKVRAHGTINALKAVDAQVEP